MTHIKRLNEYFELTRTTTHKINLYEFIESANSSGRFCVDCTTGKKSSADIYRRKYTFDINIFDGNTLSFHLNSQDYSSTGGCSYTDKYIEFGDFELTFTDKEFKENAKIVLKNVLTEIDKEFWNEYKLDDKNIIISSLKFKF